MYSSRNKKNIMWIPRLICSYATGDQEVAGWTPPDRQHSFVKIDHEIFSTIILSLLLIQEGQLSVSGKRMHTILVKGGLSLPSKSVVR